MNIRPYQDGDEAHIARICVDTWIIPEFYGEEGLQLMGLFYTLKVLNSSEHFLVACEDGVPVGCIAIGRTHGQSSRGLEDRIGFLESQLSIFEGGIRFLEELDFFDGECSIVFNGHELPETELKLIIVDRRFRMKGIARRLLDEVSRSIGSRELVLYTDSDCDIGFYDSLKARIVDSHQFIIRGQQGFSLSMIIDI